MHRGGGNSRLTSHIKGFSLIEAFNNLALWGEKKFVSELKRTYKFQRGVNNRLDCHANQTRILSKEYSFVAGDYVRSTARNDVKRHTEDNSPKYRMVGEILSILRSFAVQTRIFAKECNIIAVGYVRSTAQDDENLNRLCNKCAMTCFGNMSQNSFTDKVFSRFTSHFSLKRPAFTLAEVLVTLGIIGVVSAMTVPTLMQNYQRQSYVTQLHKTYNEMSQALLRYQTDKNALNLREAGMSSQAEVNNFISSYFKVVNSCLDSSTVTPCFANQSEYKKISGATVSGFDNDANGLGMSFVLANGTSIRPWLSNGVNFIVMVVDVNGQKGPNILGRDFFDMCIDVNGNIDTCLRNGGTFPHTEAQRETEFNDVCIADSASIAGCFGKILNDNWQMNY